MRGQRQVRQSLTCDCWGSDWEPSCMEGAACSAGIVKLEWQETGGSLAGRRGGGRGEERSGECGRVPSLLTWTPSSAIASRSLTRQSAPSVSSSCTHDESTTQSLLEFAAKGTGRVHVSVPCTQKTYAPRALAVVLALRARSQGRTARRRLIHVGRRSTRLCGGLDVV